MPIPTTGHRQSMLEHVVGFSRALHEAGLAVNPCNLLDLCNCFEFVDLARRDDFYAAARATLVSRHQDISRFDAVFALYWEALERIPIRTRGKDQEEDEDEHDKSTGTELTQPSESIGEEDSVQRKSQVVSYSPDEFLSLRDLGSLTDADIERARRLIREIVASLANKRGRRLIPRRHGRIPDLRRLLRSRAFYTADGICALTYRARRVNKTRLVLICDVSGSMQRYSSFLIEFMYALRRELSDLEVAVFSTRLTVITDLLNAKGVATSLKQVAGQVHDWAGGTNIGSSLREFNEKLGPRMVNGRTAVILLSDGWDRGNPAEMYEEMAKLRLRAQAVLWLNPLLGAPGYEPLTQSMRGVLPLLDYFLPAHNLQSLSQLAKILRTIGT